MLNRTNRKLSAKNAGLKFGTREFAIKASLNLGNLTRHFAARLETVRVDRVDVRDIGWQDAIAPRSYPAVPMRAAMPVDSSPEPRPASERGLAAGSAGQRVASASPSLLCPSHARGGHQGRGQQQATRGTRLGRSLPARTTSRLLPTPRTWIPDAAS